MTKVSILPVIDAQGDTTYCAVSGEKRSLGKTPGEALDAITTQLAVDETGTIIIFQSFKPDDFFGQAQQARLARLMERWREARDRGEELPLNEQTELEALVKAELRAATERSKGLLHQQN